MTSRRFHGLMILAIALILASASVVTANAQTERLTTDRLVRVSNDVTLRVLDAGPQDAPPIVFVPGWCFTADVWKRQIAALSDRYRVVAFDPRSQGGSTLLGHSNSPDHRADDMAGLIAALGLERPVIVGWSQGVQDTAAFALKFGTGELGGIVLVDAMVSSGASGMNAKTAAMTLQRMPIYVDAQRDYLTGMLPYLFKSKLSPTEVDAIVSAAMKTPTSVGVANLTLDLFGKDYTQAFRRIDVPALVLIAGTASDRNEQLRQPIPNASFEIIEGAGHALFYDEPAQFNERLARFIEARVSGARNR